MGTDLIVCGSAGSHPGPGRACSGYLLRAGGHQILIDCGNGCTANLLRLTSFDQLDAVVITHRHVDHCADLIGMAYDLAFGPAGPTSLPLYAAPEVLGLITGLVAGESTMDLRDVFTHVEVVGGDHVDVGPIGIDFYPAVHPVPTVSMRIEVGDTTIAYSSDTAGGDALLECARGADLFLCEATWLGDPGDWPPGFHLTAGEAGSVAAEAGVERLVLTHVLGSNDPDETVAEARNTYGGDLVVARDLDRWSLP